MACDQAGLCLNFRANVLRFMNIIVDETPVIPYEVYRRFISGSPEGYVTICGDVIGPIFPDNKPVSLKSMFPTGNGRFGKGTEYHAFNLAANTWQLHYLRLTNQLGMNKSKVQEVEEPFSPVRQSSSGGNPPWVEEPISLPTESRQLIANVQHMKTMLHV